MTDKATAEFIKELGRISNAHTTTQVFADVVRAMRVALQRPVERDADYAADLERQYMAFVDKYGAANWQHAANCMSLVIQRLEERREDFWATFWRKWRPATPAMASSLPPYRCPALWPVSTANP